MKDFSSGEIATKFSKFAMRPCYLLFLKDVRCFWFWSKKTI